MTTLLLLAGLLLSTALLSAALLATCPVGRLAVVGQVSGSDFDFDSFLLSNVVESALDHARSVTGNNA